MSLRKWTSVVLLMVMLAPLTLAGAETLRVDAPVQYEQYANDKGIGFFYPEPLARVSGITKVYGLAYVDEGWTDLERGIEYVTVRFGDDMEMLSRTYVKNRYWIRTFDSTQFEDGPLTITVDAYDLDGNHVGTAVNTVIVDNSMPTTGARYFAAPDGSVAGNGSMEAPWDFETAVEQLMPGDTLFLRGGVYTENWTIKTSGEAGLPITIMNYNGETVELVGAGIDIGYRVKYVTLIGIDQHGLRGYDMGIQLGDSVQYIEVWDCTFKDNTHPYEDIPYDNTLEFGAGFYAGTVRGGEGGNRQFITVSHCESSYNDVDGFQFSSIDHGRFQFLEAAWNPNHKTDDVFQYKHANGFVSKNSEYEDWGVGSTDNVYLFCYSHHNGQDGWDLRSPHNYLFGCISHDEAQAGHEFGGVGMKFWEYDNVVQSCVNFRNNLVDGTGAGLYARDYTSIINTLFYNVAECAVDMPTRENPMPKRIVSNNNIFVDYIKDFDRKTKSFNSIFFGKGTFANNSERSVTADPLFVDAESGNFFLQADSPALTQGNDRVFAFFVDGVDYSKLDALGRPRQSIKEIGPYTRFADEE